MTAASALGRAEVEALVGRKARRLERLAAYTRSEERCDDCGTALGELREEVQSEALLCQVCYLKRHPVSAELAIPQGEDSEAVRPRDGAGSDSGAASSDG